nr:hypothetical protein [uncultured Allomuricauda sp.]
MKIVNKESLRYVQFNNILDNNFRSISETVSFEIRVSENTYPGFPFLLLIDKERNSEVFFLNDNGNLSRTFRFGSQNSLNPGDIISRKVKFASTLSINDNTQNTPFLIVLYYRESPSSPFDDEDDTTIHMVQ